MTNLARREKCLPANYPIDINAELLKQHRILLQETQGATIVIGLGRRDALINELTKIEDLFKEYNENENRDWHGRWP
jgi:hypothetical protein